MWGTGRMISRARCTRVCLGDKCQPHVFAASAGATAGALPFSGLAIMLRTKLKPAACFKAVWMVLKAIWLF